MLWYSQITAYIVIFVLQILTVAVLAILLAAPIGAAATMIAGPPLLKGTLEQSVEDKEKASTLEKEVPEKQEESTMENKENL